MTNETMTPKQEWEALKAEVIARIKGIDDRTEWQATEPAWWLEMMNIGRALAVPDKKTHDPADCPQCKVLEVGTRR